MSNSATLSNTNERPNRALHISLWVIQILLAGMFAMAGFMKSTMAIPVLAQKLAWVESTPVFLVRFIGLSELAAAIGLILPAALRILPGLTPLSATGLLAIMILAIPFHLARGEANLLARSLLSSAPWLPLSPGAGYGQRRLEHEDESESVD
jgi:putative oxidoreductase